MKLKNTNGFTMIEMLLVVGIISTLTSISMPSFSGTLDRARAATDAANVRAAKAAALSEFIFSDQASEVYYFDGHTAKLAKDGIKGYGQSKKDVDGSNGIDDDASEVPKGRFVAVKINADGTMVCSWVDLEGNGDLEGGSGGAGGTGGTGGGTIIGGGSGSGTDFPEVPDDSSGTGGTGTGGTGTGGTGTGGTGTGGGGTGTGGETDDGGNGDDLSKYPTEVPIYNFEGSWEELQLYFVGQIKNPQWGDNGYVQLAPGTILTTKEGDIYVTYSNDITFYQYDADENASIEDFVKKTYGNGIPRLIKLESDDKLLVYNEPFVYGENGGVITPSTICKYNGKYYILQDEERTMEIQGYTHKAEPDKGRPWVPIYALNT